MFLRTLSTIGLLPNIGPGAKLAGVEWEEGQPTSQNLTAIKPRVPSEAGLPMEASRSASQCVSRELPPDLLPSPNAWHELQAWRVTTCLSGSLGESSRRPRKSVLGVPFVNPLVYGDSSIPVLGARACSQKI